MDKNELKLDLMQRLLEMQDAEVLQKVKELLQPEKGYVIPEFHKKLLQERREDYGKGDVKGSTWDEVKKRVTKK